MTCLEKKIHIPEEACLKESKENLAGNWRKFDPGYAGRKISNAVNYRKWKMDLLMNLGSN